MGYHIMIYRDMYIHAKLLKTLARQDGDVTAIPQEASLIVFDPEWLIMCAEAGGGEQALIAALGVVDVREAENGER